MSELFKDIPEFVEVSELYDNAEEEQTNLGESVTARTETLGEMQRSDADRSHLPRTRPT